MNIKVVFFVGLPGSGKTTLLVKMNDGFIIDDLSVNLTMLDDFKNNPQEILYIADPLLCLSTKKQAETKLKEMLSDFNILSFDWRMFENNLDNAWKNVEARKDNRNINYYFMKHISKCYSENHDLTSCELIPVFKRDQND